MTPLKTVSLTRQAKKDRLAQLEHAVAAQTADIHRAIIDSMIQHIEHVDPQWEHSLLTAQRDTKILLRLLENTMTILEVEHKEVS